MSPDLAISVIVETLTPSEHRRQGLVVPQLEATLACLDAQDFDRPFEVVLVAEAADVEGLRVRVAGRDNVSVLGVDHSGYYAMKNAGVAVARADRIAFIDADCWFPPHWLRVAVRHLDAGADAVAGPVRYQAEGLWPRFVSYFDFGNVHVEPSGEASSFLPNNAAFDRQFFQRFAFVEGIRRSGSCVLVTGRIRAAGRHIDFEPAMAVRHGNDYLKGGWFSRRLRNGHDAVNIRRFDHDGVVPYPWITRLGPLAAVLVVAGRLRQDLANVVRTRGQLALPGWAVPLLWVVCVPMRLVEGAAYALSSVAPQVIGRHWG